MKNLILSLTIALFSLSTFAQKKAFDVKIIGKGQPIILIPGYSCSGDVWNETVEKLKNRYECHVLTLAGFAGVAPIQDEMILNTMKNEIINYVEVKKLKKPMLIGHSLGAFMTLWLHSSKPDLFGKSICVDGLPFISAINNPLATSESVKNNPQMDKQTTIKNFIALANEGYIKNMTNAMMYQVSDSIHAKQIAEWSYKSDRRTLGSTIIEMSQTDLRQDIAKIKQPILILASLFGTKEASQKEYDLQYALLKNKTIKVANSKHFIMYDVPEWFYTEVESFLLSK